MSKKTKSKALGIDIENFMKNCPYLVSALAWHDMKEQDVSTQHAIDAGFSLKHSELICTLQSATIRAGMGKAITHAAYNAPAEGHFQLLSSVSAPFKEEAMERG